jgi:hypothetical protein
MLGEKVSNEKMHGNLMICGQVLMCGWNFWSSAAEVCDVRRKSVTRGLKTAGGRRMISG